MESEDKPYVIISRYREKVILATGRIHRGSYDNALDISKKESDGIIFNKYGIDEEGYEAVLETLDIHERPLSEVSGKVRGLVKKLKGNSQ